MRLRVTPLSLQRCRLMYETMGPGQHVGLMERNRAPFVAAHDRGMAFERAVIRQHAGS
jgi:hypothetical protein